ncbi:hypothetical protein [Pseudomonas kuykendallii]|uniref:hypothetical protein n=1 Tax=Pseudomonas kuykendallii TaxID=1007099 RepID=UPI0028D07A57|nr:hypothetical protein [Pseudomonas kuykendallii]
MSDPLDRATSKAPPTVGEGCVRRYDPEALSSEDGTEFPDAQALWERLKDGEGESSPPGETDDEGA